MKDNLSDILRACFVSPNVADANMEAANLVDVIDKATYRLAAIAQAITAPVTPGHDATGGNVGCLTEAIMGVTAGLCRIADAITELANAVSSSKESGD